MIKKFSVILLALILFMPMRSQASRVTMEHALSVLDGYKHTPAQFGGILMAIQANHPKYTSERVGDLIMKSYYKIRDHQPMITLYEVASGIKRFSQDKIGLDLTDLVVTYIESQTKD